MEPWVNLGGLLAAPIEAGFLKLVAAEGDHGVDVCGSLCGEPGGKQSHHDHNGDRRQAGGGIDCA
jgi:hypothetical protein